MTTEPFTPPAHTAVPCPAQDSGAAEATLLMTPGPDPGGDRPRTPPRRPGRPLEMSAEDVLQYIQQLSRREDGLFRVHLTTPSLYSRARRLFGSWSRALRAAGVDYESLRGAAQARSLQTRRRKRRRGARPTTP